jgi:putative intracellular protease/amidase
MHIVCLLFDGVTPLDAIGPYEVLSRLPGSTFQFVSPDGAAVRTESGLLGLTVAGSFDRAERADVLVVPGGPGTRRLVGDDTVLESIRAVHDGTTWTTSVCTGSLVLAAAGLLDGVEATTHWAERDTLASYGAVPVAERVVERGKIMTAAGVSAGIDMALVLAARLAGDVVAQAIQLGIEYDPHPPFDAGSPDKAAPDVIELVRTVLRGAAPALDGGPAR